MDCFFKMLLIVLVTVVTTVGGSFVPERRTDTLSNTNNYTVCPTGCECSVDERTAQCVFTFVDYSVTEFNKIQWKLTRLRIIGGSTSWNTEMSRSSVRDVLYRGDKTANRNESNVFSELIHLDISYIPIVKISDQDFIRMPKLQLLTLTNNNITRVESNAFKNLNNLVVLNLDGNYISKLSDGQFENLHKLERLHLRSNSLTVVNDSQLVGLDNLVTFDLQNNQLQQIDTFVQALNGLETFDVQRNQLMFVSEKAVEKLLTFKHVYIDGNPFSCTCSLKSLISTYKADSSVFVNRDVECYGPVKFQHVRFEEVDIDALPCNGANVTGVSHDSSLLYQSDLVLDCSVSGDAPLATYWITPWGDRFTSIAAKSLFPEQFSEWKVSESYYALNLLVTSNVYISDNGSLHIEKYRGYFAGDYTCVGVNLISVSNETLYLGIETKMRYLYITSLYIGASCSGFMLTLAVIIGVIRWFANKCLHAEHCCCRCDDVEIVEEIIEEKFRIEEQIVDINCSSSVETMEYIEYDPCQSPPYPPVNSPISRLSPRACRTPTGEEDEDPSKAQPTALIWHQLEEVRYRLRTGAEKRIRKVKCHVRTVTDAGSVKIQNFKDAGSVKIQHIRESSSNAASIVKNHVTSGMVQMKYGMQSIKEFCGTGDMGPGTVSMVSVSTDVDTKEQVQMVKSHTFV